MRAVALMALPAAVLSMSALLAQTPAPAYPAVYRAEKLPELPGATLVSTGRQTKSFRDGMRLQLTSSKPVADVRDFYDREMKARGWTGRDSPAARAGQANPRGTMLTFTKDRLTYAVVITSAPQKTGAQISINVTESLR